MGVNLETLRPEPMVEGYTTPGGYSGKAVKPIALAKVLVSCSYMHLRAAMGWRVAHSRPACRTCRAGQTGSGVPLCRCHVAQITSVPALLPPGARGLEGQVIHAQG